MTDEEIIMKMKIPLTISYGTMAFPLNIMTTDMPIQQKILSKQEWTPKMTPTGQQE